MSTFQRLSLSHAGRVAPPPKLEVSLTDLEDRICNLLDECVQELKRTNGIATSCRIAGGWVRDKLLGLHSNDIDVAVEDMMGLTFATHLVTFAHSRGVSATEPAVVKSNPDQSKHLETTKVKVYDIELDVVNLRSEEYAFDSRIPTEVKYGTPEEDALRRDLTINALFYNVHTRSVEDCTRRGLDDLRKGLIRTPLDPEETFHDDPLRIIRAVRFATRFGFTIVPELADAAKRFSTTDDIFAKISRERFGEEFDKMIKGRDPMRAIQLIHSLSLYEPTFRLPPAIVSTCSAAPNWNLSLSAASMLHMLLTPPSPLLPAVHPTLLSTLTPSVAARLFLAASLTPYRGIRYTDAKKRSHLAVEAVIREGLKFGSQNHYFDGVPLLFISAEKLENPVLSQERLGSAPERVAIGLLLRDRAVHNIITGSHWTTSLLFSLVQELTHVYDPVEDMLNVDAAAEKIQIYNAFVQRVEELNLKDAIDDRPILDGREVVEALGAARPGPWTGEMLSKVVQWQLEHPTGSKEECARWLTAERQAGRIVLDEGGTAPAKREKPNEEGHRGKKSRK